MTKRAVWRRIWPCASWIIPIVVGVAIAFAWMAVWALGLRAVGVPVLMRTPEERNARKQRILQMGKLRYTLVFGVFGSGFGYGLGISIALMVSRGHYNWGYAATMFGAISVVAGLMKWHKEHGTNSFRVETPFPPHYPTSK